MMTLRPGETCQSRRGCATQREELTLGTESDRDGVGEDVDALEDGGPALVGELNLLVRAALEHRLRGLCSRAADGRGGSRRETVHGESNDNEGERRALKEEEGEDGDASSDDGEVDEFPEIDARSDTEDEEEEGEDDESEEEDEEDEDGPALLELALHDVLLVNGPSRPKGEVGARDVCRGILCRPLWGQSRQRTAGRYPSRYKLTRAWLNMPVRDAERHWPLQAGRRKATKRWFMARGRRFGLTTPSRLRPPSRSARPVPLTSTAYTLLLG